VATIVCQAIPPGGADLRTLAFFEGTITVVLVCSCAVQAALTVAWSVDRAVVVGTSKCRPPRHRHACHIIDTNVNPLLLS
jgi:hypothetical protein